MTSADAKTLSARLKLARKKTGFTQAKIANLLNIEIGTLSGYERGYRRPSADMLPALANLYGVSTDYLLGQTDDPNGILEKKQTPADTAGENIGEGATLTPVRELTDILVIENEGAITFMDVPLTRQDILDVRHTIAMIMRQRLPAVIPIYPPRPPRDYSKIISIKDIDPDTFPLPEEFINLRGERINRYEIYQAEGHAKTDEEWRNTVINHKYHLPPKK